VELKSEPGKLTPTGAITPNGLAKVEVNVTFKLYAARRMGTAVLAYLHAWDVLRMMVHRRSVGQPAPYLLVAAASEQNGGPNGAAKPQNGSAQNNGIHPQQSAVANGRPVTRKSNGQANGKAAGPTHGSTAAKQPLSMAMGHWLTGKI